MEEKEPNKIIEEEDGKRVEVFEDKLVLDEPQPNKKTEIRKFTLMQYRDEMTSDNVKYANLIVGNEAAILEIDRKLAYFNE